MKSENCNMKAVIDVDLTESIIKQKCWQQKDEAIS